MRSVLSGFTAIFLFACTGEVSGGARGLDTAVTDTDTPAPDDNGLADDDAADDDPADTTPVVPTALLHYVGRFDTSDPDGALFSWSGAGVFARFTGTGVSVKLEATANHYFSAVVDDATPVVFSGVGSAPSVYAIASGLPAGEHTVQIYRRTEAFYGPSRFVELVVEGGTLVASPSPFAHRIEFVGDSITCGYGNEGASGCSGNPPAVENAYRAWGWVTAKALDASASLIAWSGKGMYSNYGGTADTTPNLPALYDRIIPTDDSSVFALTDNVPDAVVINLGTNDFSGNHPVGSGADPDAKAEYIAAYTNAYRGFLVRLRTLYPETPIFCVVGTMSSAYKTPMENAVTATADTNVFVVDLGIQSAPYGCDYHPTVATDATMGATMASAIATQLGWALKN